MEFKKYTHTRPRKQTSASGVAVVRMYFFDVSSDFKNDKACWELQAASLSSSCQRVVEVLGIARCLETMHRAIWQGGFEYGNPPGDGKPKKKAETQNTIEFFDIWIFVGLSRGF